MMKKVILFLMLLVGVGAQAATNDGHVWLKLQSSNVRMDEAVNHFGEWINLPAESTFELLSDETDQIGMRHLRYRQYVAGVEVQASMLIVHGRDGLVTTANGVVMEQQEQPKTIRRAAATRGGYENCYLVKDDDGYHYARLDYDIFGNADIYVDIETGKVVKSLPRTHSVDVTMQGRSMYSGTVPFSVSKLEDGSRVMVDATRNIYTLNALGAVGDTDNYELGINEKGQMILDRERYIQEKLVPMSTPSDFWTMPKLVEVALDKVVPQDDPFAEVYMVLRSTSLTNSYVDGSEIRRKKEVADTTSHTYLNSLPLRLKQTALGGQKLFYNLGSFSIEIWLYQYNGDDVLLDKIDMSKLDAGQHKWSTGVTSGTVTIEASAHPAVDIHWGMQQTYDWYKTVLGRDSYDAKGGPIYNILFAPEFDNDFIKLEDGNNNAFANYGPRFNCYVMEYGIGDGVVMRPVVALDIMAHEFTHLVTACTAKLEGNNNEPAALDESFSDILAISIKKAVRGSKAEDNWMIGDEVMLQVPCLRDMSHRVQGIEKGTLPIYYQGDDWENGADQHTNCSVQNYWFYLLCEGGYFKDIQGPWGPGVEVDGIGIEKAAMIAYRNLTQYMTPTSNYPDAREGALQAASDLYGEFSSEYDDVDNAWWAVGVTPDSQSTGVLPISQDLEPISENNWYNLQGQRIDKPSQAGIYIRNGKKVIIK